jgi:hypothetical protein
MLEHGTLLEVAPNPGEKATIYHCRCFLENGWPRHLIVVAGNDESVFSYISRFFPLEQIQKAIGFIAFESSALRCLQTFASTHAPLGHPVKAINGSVFFLEVT